MAYNVQSVQEWYTVGTTYAFNDLSLKNIPMGYYIHVLLQTCLNIFPVPHEQLAEQYIS